MKPSFASCKNLFCRIANWDKTISRKKYEKIYFSTLLILALFAFVIVWFSPFNRPWEKGNFHLALIGEMLTIPQRSHSYQGKIHMISIFKIQYGL